MSWKLQLNAEKIVSCQVRAKASTTKSFFTSKEKHHSAAIFQLTKNKMSGAMLILLSDVGRTLDETKDYVQSQKDARTKAEEQLAQLMLLQSTSGNNNNNNNNADNNSSNAAAADNSSSSKEEEKNFAARTDLIRMAEEESASLRARLVEAESLADSLSSILEEERKSSEENMKKEVERAVTLAMKEELEIRESKINEAVSLLRKVEEGAMQKQRMTDDEEERVRIIEKEKVRVVFLE